MLPGTQNSWVVSISLELERFPGSFLPWQAHICTIRCNSRKAFTHFYSAGDDEGLYKATSILLYLIEVVWDASNLLSPTSLPRQVRARPKADETMLQAGIAQGLCCPAPLA